MAKPDFSPKLSIITITFNDPSGLKATLESLRALQRESLAWEHIVVDSSPTENDEVLARLPLEGWPLRRVITPPEGIYPAFNVGIQAARGELVWLLNSGDRLRDTQALRQVLRKFAESEPFDLVISGVELQRGGSYLYSHRPRGGWLDVLGMNRVCHQGVIYRRTVFDRVGPFSTTYKLASDYEHHLRCLAARLAVAVLPKNVLAVFDMSGQSSKQYRLAFDEFRAIQRSLRARLPGLMGIGNEILCPVEYARVAAFKLLAASPIASALRPLWLAFKRRRA